MVITSTVNQLSVTRIKTSIKDRTILQDVSFRVDKGEMFAILGPTGSGKSTLLNVITGRLKSDSGSITVDGRPVNKEIRRSFGFVLQNDVFFTNLTLWQTLYFTAQIQMPESLSKEDKIKKVNAVVEAMGLTKCLHTVIGDLFVRGLSGGEKKRANIACELLSDPALLFLDEPTSGLDSSTAWSIVQHLKSEAASKNRIVVSTIHQPSSQIFFNFDRIILLADGQVGYYGTPEGVQSHFSNLGLHCRVNYNPADFLLELANADQPTIDKMIESVQPDQLDQTRGDCDIENGKLGDQQGVSMGGLSEEDVNGATGTYRKLPSTYSNAAFEENGYGRDISLELEANRPNGHTMSNVLTKQRWATSFWHQLKMLTWRGFLQSKGKVINRYSLTELVVVNLCIILAFFRKGVGYEQRSDVMGLIFMTLGYWNFFITVQVLLVFPEQRPVIAKERASGAYRMSALYLSRTVSDTPIFLCLSMVLFTISFWVGNLGDGIVYLKAAAVFALWIMFVQAEGYFLGALSKSPQFMITAFQAYAISAFIYGGFIFQYIPYGFQWMKYLSVNTYAFGAMVTVVLGNLEPISCNHTSLHASLTDSPCFNRTMVTGDVILKDAGIDLPLLYYIIPLIGIDVCLRVIAYFTMRYKKDNIF